MEEEDALAAVAPLPTTPQDSPYDGLLYVRSWGRHEPVTRWECITYHRRTKRHQQLDTHEHTRPPADPDLVCGYWVWGRNNDGPYLVPYDDLVHLPVEYHWERATQMADPRSLLWAQHCQRLGRCRSRTLVVLNNGMHRWRTYQTLARQVVACCSYTRSDTASQVRHYPYAPHEWMLSRPVVPCDWVLTYNVPWTQDHGSLVPQHDVRTVLTCGWWTAQGGLLWLSALGEHNLWSWVQQTARASGRYRRVRCLERGTYRTEVAVVSYVMCESGRERKTPATVDDYDTPETTATTVAVPRRKQLSSAQKWQIAAQQRFRCNRCQELLTEVDFDHVSPLHQGGSNELHNMQALCLNCHRQKTREECGKRKQRSVQ